MQGINWWGLDDSYRFVEDGGLFDEAGRPKMAARRLAALLESWRGDRQVSTDDEGWASFAGPAGDYRATARAGADTASAAFHIAEGVTTTIVMNATNAPALAARADGVVASTSSTGDPRP